MRAGPEMGRSRDEWVGLRRAGSGRGWVGGVATGRCPAGMGGGGAAGGGAAGPAGASGPGPRLSITKPAARVFAIAAASSAATSCGSSSLGSLSAPSATSQ